MTGDDWVQAARRALWLEVDTSPAKADRLGFVRRRVSREEKSRIAAGGLPDVGCAPKPRCAGPPASLGSSRGGHRRCQAEPEDPAAQPPFVPVLVDDLPSERVGDDRGRWRCRAPSRRQPGHADRGRGGAPGAVGVSGPGVTPRIVLATRPANFKKRHHGLAAVVEHTLGLDPCSGVQSSDAMVQPESRSVFGHVWGGQEGTDGGSPNSAVHLVTENLVIQCGRPPNCNVAESPAMPLSNLNLLSHRNTK